MCDITMKKKLHVMHQHLYTKESQDLFIGEATHDIYDDYEQYTYEEETGAKVILRVYENYAQIERIGDVHSILKFIENEDTTNLIKSEFGDMNIDLFTHLYRKDDNQVVIAYDVLHSQDHDGFKITFMMKGDLNEYN
ncbi:uncharacterized beta-barrel protein YwiB (DUF1934 family) [Breznakia sp. PH1-1]|nr:uncharacterized beta-barrel protein YwiB (DUF1934 family) [Breznakia sp. PH1-1]MDH6404020.1 uncharacterized beta-barrel protein YwiB (DUF1934 family) [Breznakia sp. PF1-11]MDH6411758.1 uncharacterized beta-barrel protein YwiB (DUF1934 family) [Breznakia sp. PFB1-11]MDH6414008.1 uncharacterized beta-barrel protein YwiB (DUF1934 family) [Breznakia sp. PFB1-14]MDH6416438.1 uncharacterized beta-barrel protein YwiB (DUF1934 family) [Breznakia sp. PFB1-4]MDH6418761.1 uncharacterized beta-barrel p